MTVDLARLQRMIDYQFTNPDLLKEAMMHRSFATEHGLHFDNQRLEFLGDAVLQIVLTEYLFQKYPDFAEGKLTKIRSAMVNQDSLSAIARKISLGDYLMLGKGEIECGGASRDSTLCDALESLFGAIYLDSNGATVRTFILKLMKESYEEPALLIQTENPKGTLQELCQHQFGETPVYKTLSVTGEEHDPVFTVQVSVGAVVLAEAAGGKRKHAESNAAAAALENIRSGKVQLSSGDKKEGNTEK